MFNKINTEESAYSTPYRMYVPKNKPESILLGYEYENQVPQDLKQDIPKWFNQSWDPFNMHINAYGWEIRSPVAPLEFHRRVWNRYFNNGKFQFNREPSAEIPTGAPYGKPGGHGAGIHVSVSKTTFTNARYPKVLSLLSDHGTLQKLSGRSLNQYTKYVKNYNVVYNNTNRYECRLFTAHPDLLIPALEFTESVFLTNEDNYLGWRNFVEASDRYSHLRDRLRELSI